MEKPPTIDTSENACRDWREGLHLYGILSIPVALFQWSSPVLPATESVVLTHYNSTHKNGEV